MEKKRTIAEREPQHPMYGQFLRDIVFGVNDGVVTTVGFLVGISGTVIAQNVIVIAGFLGAVAGAVSMALGNYLAVKSQREFYDAMEKIERWEMENKPEVERDEIREIYTNYGFDKETIELLTKKVTADRELWLRVMMKEELGLTKDEAPAISGFLIGLFFLVGGIPVVLPYMFMSPIPRALIASIFVAIIVLGLVGTFRWWLSKGNFGARVLESIMVGILAAMVGFLAGEALRFFGISGVSL